MKKKIANANLLTIINIEVKKKFLGKGNKILNPLYFLVKAIRALLIHVITANLCNMPNSSSSLLFSGIATPDGTIAA